MPKQQQKRLHREETRGHARPLDYTGPLAGDILLEAGPLKIGFGFDPVQVQVRERQITCIFVSQGKRRARHLIRIGSKSRKEAFGKLGFSAAEITRKGDDHAGSCCRTQASSEVHSLLGGVCAVGEF